MDTNTRDSDTLALDMVARIGALLARLVREYPDDPDAAARALALTFARVQYIDMTSAQAQQSADFQRAYQSFLPASRSAVEYWVGIHAD